MDLQTDLRDAAKRDLVADVARSFGQVRLKVTGTSMLPSVWPGDILTVDRCNIADLFPGQIVLCYRNQELVAHRLAGRVGNYLITRGDSLCYYDRPFLEDEVLGLVVSMLRGGKERPVQPGLSRLSRLVASMVQRSEWFLHQCMRWNRLTTEAHACTGQLENDRHSR